MYTFFSSGVVASGFWTTIFWVEVTFLEGSYVNPVNSKDILGKDKDVALFKSGDWVNLAKNLKPSSRGELEITSVNEIFLSENRLRVNLFGRGYAWLDTGAHEDLLEASKFIETIERRQGLKVACIEEIAFEKGYISKKELKAIANIMKNNQYGKYLLSLL